MFPLHVFVFMLFVIGVLLTTISFFAYSKLGDKCTSTTLRTKLRIAIAIGSALFSLAVGYYFCVNDSHCNCSFDTDKMKINTMLTISLLLGVGLLVLTLGIKSELSKPDCNVDLGILPTLLLGIAGLQISSSVLYLANMIIKGLPEKKPSPPVPEQDSDDTIEMKALARKQASEQRLMQKLKAELLTKQADLASVRESILANKYSNKNPTIDDLQKQSKLVQEISKINEDISSVNTSSSSSLPSSSLQTSSVRQASLPFSLGDLD